MTITIVAAAIVGVVIVTAIIVPYRAAVLRVSVILIPAVFLSVPRRRGVPTTMEHVMIEAIVMVVMRIISMVAIAVARAVIVA